MKHPIVLTLARGKAHTNCRGCGWQSPKVEADPYGLIALRITTVGHRAVQ
jgi:hypothetical protein